MSTSRIGPTALTDEIPLAYWGNTYTVDRRIIEYIMTRYYDLVLALIPVVLLGVGGTLLLAGVPQPIAVSLAGTAAVGMIGHAIFVNGPVASTASTDHSDAQSSSAGNGSHAVQAD